MPARAKDSARNPPSPLCHSLRDHAKITSHLAAWPRRRCEFIPAWYKSLSRDNPLGSLGRPWRREELMPRQMSYPNSMWMRAGRWVAAMGFVPFLCAAAPPPSAWVPVRWPWADTRSLELLTGTPVNCLLLRSPAPELVAAARARGVVALAVVTPGGEAGKVDGALAAKVDGIVLEGEFPEGAAARIAAHHKGIAVLELTSRNRLALGSAAPVLGTYQGVWPGIAVDDGGARNAGPTASVWIDTNPAQEAVVGAGPPASVWIDTTTGFLPAVRAWGAATVWIANQPPPQTAVAATRYLHVIADAGISGAHWVVAFDADLAGRLAAREEAAMGTWKRIAGMLAYFEQHPEWRAMPEGGQLAVVQDPGRGGLVSGGIRSEERRVG